MRAIPKAQLNPLKSCYLLNSPSSAEFNNNLSKSSAHRQLSWTTYILKLCCLKLRFKSLLGSWTGPLFGQNRSSWRILNSFIVQSSPGRRSAPSNFPAEMCIKSEWKSLVISFQSITTGRWSKFRWGIDFVSNLQNNITHESFLRKLGAEWYTDIQRSGAIK